MANLVFLFKEFLDEIEAISHMARSFISPESLGVLPELKGNLQSIQDSKNERIFRWSIPESRPLRTITSEGRYERGGRGRHMVYAEITSCWEIRPLRPLKSPKKSKWERFNLEGIASTRVKIFSEPGGGPPEELAMWRMEVGDENAPGCFFHVQILGETEDPPFPRSLSVPRLPLFLATPTVALEFVLGELFQDEWGRKGLLREDGNLQRWRTIQSERLASFLIWQQGEVQKDGALGSPWVRLKSLKPNATLFLQGQ